MSDIGVRRNRDTIDITGLSPEELGALIEILDQVEARGCDDHCLAQRLREARLADLRGRRPATRGCWQCPGCRYADNQSGEASCWLCGQLRPAAPAPGPAMAESEDVRCCQL